MLDTDEGNEDVGGVASAGSMTSVTNSANSGYSSA